LTGTIRVGMSGFSYPEWIGEIYPKGTKRNAMLAAYANVFPTVEINMSFRRLPAETTMDKWRDAVPDTFRFTMKAYQIITHWRRLVDVGDNVTEFMDLARRLGPRLGAVLFQIPATLKFDAALLDGFGPTLPADTAYAFEPRDESFLTDEAKGSLRRNGLALCLNDDLFQPTSYEVTGPVAYFRFHREQPYSHVELESRAERVKWIAKQGTDVYVFFSHEDNPESVRPALRFQELVNY
jgi:uncharacterized protein YecE (DUF72 family)